MPLHYSSASTRRQFLVRTLAAGAAILSTRLGFSAEADEERWVLMSDTHIAADPHAMKHGVTMSAHLERAVQQAGALAPTNVIVNGDLSLHNGQPGDYTQFAKLMQPLVQAGFALHCTMGNHDARPVFWQQLADQGAKKQLMEGRHLTVLETPKSNWFLLDSLERTLYTPGLLGEEQLKWLATELDARPDKPAIVMMHHDVLPREKEGKKPGLIDVDSLLSVTRPRRQVKAIFCGHTHRWAVAEDTGIHLVNLPAVAYTFQGLEMSAWTDCRLRAHGMRLERLGLDPQHPSNGAAVELAWRA